MDEGWGILSLSKQPSAHTGGTILLFAASIRPLPAQNIQITINPTSRGLGNLLPEISRQTGIGILLRSRITEDSHLATGKSFRFAESGTGPDLHRNRCQLHTVGSQLHRADAQDPAPESRNPAKPETYRLTGYRPRPGRETPWPESRSSRTPITVRRQPPTVHIPWRSNPKRRLRSVVWDIRRLWRRSQGVPPRCNAPGGGYGS